MTTFPALQTDALSKTYGSLRALEGLFLTVQPGQVVGLLGPNGAGKTTALNLMMGLSRPSSGTVRIFGQDPRGPQARRRMGAMLQESDLPATIEVGELLELYARFYARPLARARVLELADLSAQARRRVGTLSGGQKRRLIFALSIVGDPELLFLDEPTVAMDVGSRGAFWAVIREFKRQGKTVLLTTHHLEEADALSDRIVLMNGGKLLTQGSPSEIKAQVGGSRIRFRTHGVTAQTLSTLPGVSQATLEDGRADLLSQTPERTLEELFAYRVPLSELEVTRASLEEAFLSLTA